MSFYEADFRGYHPLDRAYVDPTVEAGECRVVKAADPEKAKEYREKHPYVRKNAFYMRNKNRKKEFTEEELKIMRDLIK